MSQMELLGKLTSYLYVARIPFMVTGSVASGFHGEPRSTYDLDIVIDPTSDSLDMLLNELQADYYVNRQTARDALRDRRMFNVIDHANGMKADLIVRKARAYSEEEFLRRMPACIGGVDVFVVTPEDSIISKLEWAEQSASERQYRDAVKVAQTLAAKLDRSYVEQWCGKLGLAGICSRLFQEAGL